MGEVRDNTEVCVEVDLYSTADSLITSHCIANVTYDITSYSQNILIILCHTDYLFREKSEMQCRLN